MTEWLRAHGADDATPEWVRAAVHAGEPSMLDQVARFCDLDPAAPERWLRRHRGHRIAVTRGERSWTFDALAGSGDAWRDAGGIAPTPPLLHAIARCLLLDEVRPDDTVEWHDAPDDPLGWAPLALGAAIRLRPG
jgi:hypothetical protein